MKKYVSRSWVWAMGLIVLAAQIPSGCDSGTGDNSELDNSSVNQPYVAVPGTGIPSTVSTSSSQLSISADAGILSTNGMMAVFRVSGGTAPYSWNVTDGLRGDIQGSKIGLSVIYMRYSSGPNAVTVVDGVNSRDSRVINQP